MCVPVAPLALMLGAVSFSLCSQTPPWTYHFVDKSLTWSEAQQFCRRHFHDLACVSSSEDNLSLPRPPGYSAPVWIGLYDDPTDLSQWKWAATNSSGSFVNWKVQNGSQYSLDPQQCSHIYNSTWRNSRCSREITSLCYSGSSPKVFHLIIVKMNSSNALTHCRAHFTDLALIESADENHAASEAAGGKYARIGLFRSTGKWSDNRAVVFTAWTEPGVTKVYHEPFCAAQNQDHTWGVFSCQERRPFYCQEEPKIRRFVKMEFSGHGLDDPLMKQQILDQIQKRFAAAQADVKMKWSDWEKREERTEPPEDCLNV